MHVDDSPAFTARLVALGELFDVSLSATRQALYFEALSDLTIEQAVQALNLAVKTCRFFPKPVEIRELAMGDSEVVTERAWLEFRAAQRRVGGYSDVTFADGALARAIEAMFDRWDLACWAELSPEMWASKRKEFGRVYGVMCAETAAGPMTLEGYCSRNNRLRYGVADPLRALPAVDGVKALPPADVSGLIDQEREQRERQRVQRRENVARAIEAAVDRRQQAPAEASQ
jgi:hypothetical protein